MTRATYAGVLALITLALPPESPMAMAAGADPVETVSLARIRQALEQAPQSQIMVLKVRGDFKVEVHEKVDVPDTKSERITILDTLDFSPGPIIRAPELYPSAAPLVIFDATPLFDSLAAKVRNARRERAERAAQAEAREELREFCAAHVCNSVP
jgi:hypothetical protein